MRQLRLIYDSPTPGHVNMAVDEAIMGAVSLGESLPTLRLYAWEPACLSLGYGQRWREADIQRLKVNGWGLVRRATGGKAILHTDELTYSIALPEDHPLAQGDIVQSYRRISRALLAALDQIGLRSQADKRADGVKTTGPVCFEVPSHYEITTMDGRKLVGSAQLRRKGAVLQHGSLPLRGDVARICDALVYESEAQREVAKGQVRRRAATLADALGQVVAWDEAAQAVAAGFEDTFGLVLTEGTLSEDEKDQSQRLADEVYNNPGWTQRR